MLAIADLQPLLGQPPDSAAIRDALAALSNAAALDPDVKTYPDATYHNHYTLGLSLCFLPAASGLELDSVDIFNPTAAPSSSKLKPKVPQYSPPPLLLVRFAEREVVLPPQKEGEGELRYPRDETFEVTSSTKGKDIVRILGEPSRKGAGGWVGVWLEWGRIALLRGESGERVEVGLMLELQDPKDKDEVTAEQKQKGMGGTWDRAAGWPWSSIKIFRPSK